LKISQLNENGNDLISSFIVARNQVDDRDNSVCRTRSLSDPEVKSTVASIIELRIITDDRFPDHARLNYSMGYWRYHRRQIRASCKREFTRLASDNYVRLRLPSSLAHDESEDRGVQFYSSVKIHSLFFNKEHPIKVI